MDKRTVIFLLISPLGAPLGAVIGAAVTVLSLWVGTALESALHTTLYSWELTPIGVIIFNIAGGLVSGILGVASRGPIRGLVIGAILHAVVFSWLVFGTASLRAAPSTVQAWVLGVGIVAGALAGLASGALGRTLAR